MSEHDAMIESDLHAVDEALASGAVTAERALERELQELSLALAAQAEEPDPAFAGELRGRVRQGFPRPRRAMLRGASARLRRPPMIALAGAASIMAAVVVAISLGGDSPDQQLGTTQGGGGSDSSLAQPRETAPETESDSALPQAGTGASAPSVPPPANGFAPGPRERRIERSASLTLTAPDEELGRVADEIATVTDRHRGFVLSSSVSSGEEGSSTGSFELRVPTGRLQPALRDLSELADVRARSQSGQDVTREFVSAADRLGAARAERRSLLRRLEEANDDTEAESLRRQLDLVAAEINGLRGQLRDLRLRADYAMVSVSLEGSDEGGFEGGGSDDGLRGALEDALGSLAASVEILVRTLGVAIPLGLLSALAWLSARALRRRRREAALS